MNIGRDNMYMDSTQQYMIVGFAQKRKVEELENFHYFQDGIILEIK